MSQANERPALLYIENTPPDTMVGMGQVVFGQAPQRLASILGSCVGVSLYHPRTHQGVLAHVLLPDSQGRPQAPPGKFADTAIPHMLKLLAQAGLSSGGLLAKLAGGANMFNHNGPLQIGAANCTAVARALACAGLRVAAQDIGGTQGRRISLDCATGDLIIEVSGSEMLVI
jgi:chemotaxis protein CheD